VEAKSEEGIAPTFIFQLSQKSGAFGMQALQMFRFTWFENVFNSKDTGPLGLILFALLGLVVGGIMGWRLINYCRRKTVPISRNAG
jgi:hypothetical protein